MQRSHTREVLHLYRSFLRAGQSMAKASPNHALHVLRRAKLEFREPLAADDSAAQRLRLAAVLLEQLRAQSVYPGFGELRTPDERSSPLAEKDSNFW